MKVVDGVKSRAPPLAVVVATIARQHRRRRRQPQIIHMATIADPGPMRYGATAAAVWASSRSRRPYPHPAWARANIAARTTWTSCVPVDHDDWATTVSETNQTATSISLASTRAAADQLTGLTTITGRHGRMATADDNDTVSVGTGECSAAYSVVGDSDDDVRSGAATIDSRRR
ncbi:hypothetical protein PBRA_007443 [Plasmodiophora brassicae]|uniref:Uncharacterized protein n=1 Tax=Plasmodiophora brassicae TaxID=37360 RepID=A0A0G4IWN5_PLABS|nr:hypothetical protein PBRA_007443 [Plasmodiophora brassicae]